MTDRGGQSEARCDSESLAFWRTFRESRHRHSPVLSQFLAENWQIVDIARQIPGEADVRDGFSMTSAAFSASVPAAGVLEYM